MKPNAKSPQPDLTRWLNYLVARLETLSETHAHAEKTLPPRAYGDPRVIRRVVASWRHVSQRLHHRLN
jgi:pyridoxine/pyridoxamine 5'-phosphate oxidase